MAATELPFALYRAAQVRNLDRVAIEEFQIPGYTLMSRAGEAAFRLLREVWPNAPRVTVLCGVGNNGGDGYVVARLAQQHGFATQVLQVGDDSRIRGDALQALEEYRASQGEWGPFQGRLPRDSGVVVDALFGTGLERPVEGLWRAAIQQINEARRPVLAIDIPSGLHADTGAILGEAVRATHTISFIGLKQGLFTGEGRACCGQLHFDGLGVPPKIYAHEMVSAQRLVWNKLAHLLPPRSPTAHKGNFGHVLVVGGERGFTGAVRMAAEAAARAGAGLVSVATRAEHAGVLNAGRPELMCHGIEQPTDLEPLLQRATVIALGPGLSTGEWGRGLWERVLRSDRPLVIDADGLNLLARATEGVPSRDNWVLTPHPGEAGRLLQCPVVEIQQNRFAAARRLRERFGGVIVLKGSGTLVEVQDRAAAICDAGNPGMASGGMGDVLTGLIAGLLAQDLDLAEAARAGVCLHSVAADEAAQAGERGLLASDLLAPLRRLLNP